MALANVGSTNDGQLTEKVMDWQQEFVLPPLQLPKLAEVCWAAGDVPGMFRAVDPEPVSADGTKRPNSLPLINVW